MGRRSIDPLWPAARYTVRELPPLGNAKDYADLTEHEASNVL